MSEWRDAAADEPDERLALIEVWTFRRPAPAGVDLAGFGVEATDGRIGKVDEATHEAGGSYLIVDTGRWILYRRVMVPAGLVERIDPEARVVHVSRTKEEIKAAPAFDEERLRDSQHRARLGRHHAGAADVDPTRGYGEPGRP